MTERCPTCHRSFQKDRSNNQNRYYWGVVVKLICDHTGYSADEIHEILKYKFLSYPITLLAKEKEELYVATSTTKLDTKQFEDYLSRVREWASIKLGVFIPQPNEAECIQ